MGWGGWTDGMVWVGWSLESRLSRPGRHIGVVHSKRSRRSQAGQGQVGVGVGTGQDKGRLIGRNRKVARQVSAATCAARVRTASASASACASASASACKCGQMGMLRSAVPCKCSAVRCDAMRCGAVRVRRRVERTGNGHGVWAGAGGGTRAWPGALSFFSSSIRGVR